MKQIDLLNTPQAKLLVEDNVAAVTSDTELLTVSSAIYNGGFKRVKAILNIQVPEGYSDLQLHEDPLHLVQISSQKVGVSKDFLAMITAAKIRNMVHTAKTDHGVTVNVVATAGASHGESAGERINADHLDGTINIIVLINAKPTDSCLVAAFVTATEAKTAALNDLDIRSRYSGEAATGSITDSLSVATTGPGPAVELGGPASKLGQLVGSCVRAAVFEALQKQDGTLPSRSVTERLKARHQSVDKLASEFSKLKTLHADERALTEKLNNALRNPLHVSCLLAAAKLDDDVKKGIVPIEFGNVGDASERFGSLVSKDRKARDISKSELETVDVSPFLKQTLLRMFLDETNDSSKAFVQPVAP
jgi:adenosylcobinamide amidohydrolase